ncbi:hypothetical protein Emag_002293 [Eimeria magna]
MEAPDGKERISFSDICTPKEIIQTRQKNISVDTCISFAAQVLPWNPETTSLHLPAATAGEAAAAAAAGEGGEEAVVLSSRRARSYVDITTTSEEGPELSIPDPSRFLTNQSLHAAEINIRFPISMLSVHRASPRLLLCAARMRACSSDTAAAAAAAAAAASAAAAVRSPCSAADEEETMDYLFGLQFESEPSQISFFRTISKLKHQQNHQQQHQQHQQQQQQQQEEEKNNRGHLIKMEGTSVSSYFNYYGRHTATTAAAAAAAAAAIAKERGADG